MFFPAYAHAGLLHIQVWADPASLTGLEVPVQMYLHFFRRPGDVFALQAGLEAREDHLPQSSQSQALRLVLQPLRDYSPQEVPSLSAQGRMSAPSAMCNCLCGRVRWAYSRLRKDQEATWIKAAIFYSLGSGGILVWRETMIEAKRK